MMHNLTPAYVTPLQDKVALKEMSTYASGVQVVFSLQVNFIRLDLLLAACPWELFVSHFLTTM